jgi:hypothetical protein
MATCWSRKRKEVGLILWKEDANVSLGSLSTRIAPLAAMDWESGLLASLVPLLLYLFLFFCYLTATG